MLLPSNWLSERPSRGFSGWPALLPPLNEIGITRSLFRNCRPIRVLCAIRATSQMLQPDTTVASKNPTLLPQS